MTQPAFQRHFWAGGLLSLLAIISYTITFFSFEDLRPANSQLLIDEYWVTIVFMLIMALITLVTTRGQRRSELALTESEEKYTDLVHHAADPIITLDQLGVIRSANTVVEKIAGYKPHELIGRHFLKVNILVQESTALATKEFLRLIRGEIRPPFELKMLTKSGALIITEANARLIRNPFGKTRVQVIIREITARKKAEEVLRQERNMAKNYLNIAGVMILGLDKQQNVFLINRKGCEILGRKEEEVLGQNWFDHFVPNNLSGIMKTGFAQLLTGETVILPNTEYPVITKNGEHRLISWHSTAIRDDSGEVLGTLSSGQDITEQRKAEDQLRLQSAALEAAANAIVITDNTGTIVWVNNAFTEMSGYTRSEVVGRNPRVLRSGLHNSHFYQQLWDTILSGNIWHGEVINRRKDDRLYTEEMTITPVKNKDGEIQHFIAIKRDITERKRLQQGLEQANLDLAANSHKLQKTLEEMAETNRQLKEAQNQLLQNEKLAAIGVLSSGIAHEIKNPLGIISLSAEELESMSHQLSDQGKSYLQMVKRAADRANNVIIELLNFARVSELKMEPIDLKDVINGTITLAQNSSKLKAISLTHQASDDKITVLADRILLEQALFNLLINAIDAIEKNGSITIKSYLKKSQTKTDAVFEVVDTGCGIDPEILPRIFEPFFTTKEQGKGTGLGLSTAYSLIKRHRGSIDVQSKPGEGTTFIVTLPLAPQHNP